MTLKNKIDLFIFLKNELYSSLVCHLGVGRTVFQGGGLADAILLYNFKMTARKILIAEIHIPPVDLKQGALMGISKDRLILEWLKTWIEDGLNRKIFYIGDIIPSKADLAKYHNVSTGTMQNAIRYAEDLGYFRSRQCVGTMIADKTQADFDEKAISKKDAAVGFLKKYIIEHRLKKGSRLPSARELAIEADTSQNTIRLALEILVSEKIINHNNANSPKSTKTMNLDYTEIKFLMDAGTKVFLKSENLSKRMYTKIKHYIAENYKVNDKIMPNEDFAKLFNVSVRTINDAMKRLNKEKIVQSLRGQYGTRYVNEPEKLIRQKEAGEKSKFMSAPKGQKEIKNSYSYSWQRVLDQIKKYIITNHEAGDRLPSMKSLAVTLDVSTNTIRRAVKELSKQGILFCQRGKTGGMFIVEVPPKEDAFTWLALNPKFLVQ